jgi:hypothetical protein
VEEISPAQELLDQLVGAQIVSSYIESDEGLHLVMADGRVLVVAGHFGLSILKSEVLH